MFGDASLYLIDTLKREKDNNKISVYEVEKTRQLCQETIQLGRELVPRQGNGDVYNASEELYNGVKERNIKILSMYHQQRLKKLQPFVIKGIEIPEGVHFNLNEKETDFCDKYNEIILNFKRKLPET